MWKNYETKKLGNGYTGEQYWDDIAGVYRVAITNGLRGDDYRCYAVSDSFETAKIYAERSL